MEKNYDPSQLTRMSRYLCLLLRHRPDQAGITLDKHGWTDVDMLIRQVCACGKHLDREMLDYIVAHDEKGRYSYTDDGKQIRANQGHTLSYVDVCPTRAEPPAVLYHGTVARVYDCSIRHQGLSKMKRNYVHLSSTEEVAEQVSLRRRKTGALLVVDSGRMAADGYSFYLSSNRVWMTDHVPPQYLSLLRILPYEKEKPKQD